MTKLNVLKDLLQAVERFDYVVLRNYEGLPYAIGHDIDLLVKKEDRALIQDSILSVLSKYDVDVYCNDRYDTLNSYLIVFDDEILHFDLFTSVKWGGLPLINVNEVISRKKNYNGIFVISDKDLAKYYYQQYLLTSGNLKKEVYFNLASQHSKLLADNSELKKERRNEIKRLISSRKLSVIADFLSYLKGKIERYLKPYGRIVFVEDKRSCTDIIEEYVYLGAHEIERPITSISDFLDLYKYLSKEKLVLINKGNYNHSKFKFLMDKFIVKGKGGLRKIVRECINSYRVNISD